MHFLRWMWLSVFIIALVYFPPSACPDFLSSYRNYSIEKVFFFLPSLLGRTKFLCSFDLLLFYLLPDPCIKDSKQWVPRHAS